MTAAILVTGGTGTLGRLVVVRMGKAGHAVRVLSRSEHESTDDIEYVTGEIETGEGLDAAVAGIDIIVHCAGSQKGDADKARNLVRAAAASGRNPHLVYISVVGADRIPVASGLDRTMFGYFEAKRAAEEIIADSGLPFTTLRATQFHDLSFTAVRAIAGMPVIPSPSRTRFQPIDADEVAVRLAELALGAPAGLVAEMGGPRAYTMTELIRSYLRATGKRRPILQMRMPGKAAAAIRDGANLALDHAVGHRSWEDFLSEKLAATAKQNA